MQLGNTLGKRSNVPRGCQKPRPRVRFTTIRPVRSANDLFSAAGFVTSYALWTARRERNAPRATLDLAPNIRVRASIHVIGCNVPGDDDLAKPNSAEMVTDHRQEGFERREGRAAWHGGLAVEEDVFARSHRAGKLAESPSRPRFSSGEPTTKPRFGVRLQALRPEHRREARQCGARAARSQELGAPRRRDAPEDQVHPDPGEAS